MVRPLMKAVMRDIIRAYCLERNIVAKLVDKIHNFLSLSLLDSLIKLRYFNVVKVTFY